jgi:nitrite reductase/ring-hydroxylating ferredoxin subunit/uncharacterized membrane protein
MGAAQQLDKLAAEQDWLDAIADVLQPLVGEAFAAAGPAGQRIKNLLHGTWLGHPLHPALTDIPIGSWAMAVTLDTMETLGAPPVVGQAADAAVGVGVLGAVGAAAAGLTDWKETDGESRRVGLVHAALNSTALLLFVTSWLLRGGGDRTAARWAARLGFGVATASAALGGSLVYGRRVGVDHAVNEDLPTDWVAVLPDKDLVENTPRRVDAGSTPVLLVRSGGRILAIGETCSHLGGPLSEGEIADGAVTCPWHASRFSLADGRVLDGPATFPEPCFEARIRDGQIEVRVAGI